MKSSARGRKHGHNLPVAIDGGFKAAQGEGARVWILISAFLSLKAAQTQRTYRSILEEWCQFLKIEPGSNEGAKRIVAANDLAAVAYRKWLEKRIGQKPRFTGRMSSETSLAHRRASDERRDGTQMTLSNATIRKKIAALRRIYRMLQASDIGVNGNPFDSDKVPPPAAQSGQKRPTEMVDFDLVKKVIETPTAKTIKGVRDRAILAVLFGGGLRRAEAVALRLADVRRTQKGTLYLRLRATKGRKDSDQALPKWAARYVEDLCRRRAEEDAESGDYLFISYRGRGGTVATKHPLSDSGLYRLFKLYCRKAGAGAFLSPHSARATAITKLLADGIGHREVQEFSRHASVQMVEVYDKRRIGVDENPAKDLDF